MWNVHQGSEAGWRYLQRGAVHGAAEEGYRGWMMCGYAMEWAWNQKLSPTQKLVLLALAEQIGGDDDSWPCELSLGRLTGLPVRTVSKAMRELEAQGVILCLRLRLMKERRDCCGLSCFVDLSG